MQSAQKRYLRGSEWRKWDLHLHAPGTKLSDGYRGTDALDRFCAALEESDVAVFGITDYFSADGFFAVKERCQYLYPQSEKVLLPNIEMRLSETVNKDNQQVDIHLILRPDISQGTVGGLLRELKTEITDSNGRHLSCSELNTCAHFEQATVTRGNIESAIAATFGKLAVRSDNLLIAIPANNNGIRAVSGQQRKSNLADQIDKLADTIFGSSVNTKYFMRSDRFEDPEQRSKPKPVFACSDAHSFDDLANWLGRSVDSEEHRKEVTWIKADPTYEGLQQTLYEPANRVRIQPAKPEQKEPYKVISAIHFTGPDFPETILLNDSLVSIIGSRSSGKSSLLAYMAHAIDSKYAIEQQIASGIMSESNSGPAAGKTWKEVSDITCTIEWADLKATQGKVIYIPQNSLFAVSERPEEITQKIAPVLFRNDPTLHTAYQRMHADIDLCKTRISNAVSQWFRIDDQMKSLSQELRGLGDPAAVRSTRDDLATQIAKLRESARLSEEDIIKYQKIIEQLAVNSSRRQEIRQEVQAIAPYLAGSSDQLEAVGVSVSITISPPVQAFPAVLGTQLASIVNQAGRPLQEEIRKSITDYQLSLRTEEAGIVANDEKIRADNEKLIERNQANTELEDLVRRHSRQEELLKAITDQQGKLDRDSGLQDEQAAIIDAEIGILDGHIQDFIENFESKKRSLEKMTFGVEFQKSEAILQALATSFNRQENTEYVERASEVVKLENIRADPGKFLRSLRDGSQRLRVGVDPINLATQALQVASEVRFNAVLEGDRIGGFKRSSMTPGKQSLFALGLILNESAEGWPLLIDQPEDDLDSRSVFNTIVPYLVERKRERQIIMASHDPNLVIGADSDQLVVANRHGDDRKNRDARTFDYLTGSLEYSLPERPSDHVLGKCGTREHACEILDGGAEAFQKRRDKYNI